jgi:hypothetical protein
MIHHLTRLKVGPVWRLRDCPVDNIILFFSEADASKEARTAAASS